MPKFRLEIFFKDGQHFIWMRESKCNVTIENKMLKVTCEETNKSDYYYLADMELFIIYNY